MKGISDSIERKGLYNKNIFEKRYRVKKGINHFLSGQKLTLIAMIWGKEWLLFGFKIDPFLEIEAT